MLLGPSGSGKSTLLNILGGLDHATAGTVRFRDHELTSLDDTGLTAYRRNHVGFVFQFYNLIPALDLIGLGPHMDHFRAQLSGGEQQRVAIARAIAKMPDVLLCDEPTGALDSKTGVLVLEALMRINKEQSTTTALITHNAAIRENAHRTFHFGDGRIASVEVNCRRQDPPLREFAAIAMRLGIPSALRYGVLAQHTLMGLPILDAIDQSVSNFLLPTTGLLIAFLVGWRMARTEALADANITGSV